MGVPAEIAYNEGFIEGQYEVLEEIIQIVNDWGSWKEATQAIRDYVTNKEMELDSL